LLAAMDQQEADVAFAKAISVKAAANAEDTSTIVKASALSDGLVLMGKSKEMLDADGEFLKYDKTLQKLDGVVTESAEQKVQSVVAPVVALGVDHPLVTGASDWCLTALSPRTCAERDCVWVNNVCNSARTVQSALAPEVPISATRPLATDDWCVTVPSQRTCIERNCSWANNACESAQKVKSATVPDVVSDWCLTSTSQHTCSERNCVWANNACGSRNGHTQTLLEIASGTGATTQMSIKPGVGFPAQQYFPGFTQAGIPHMVDMGLGMPAMNYGIGSTGLPVAGPPGGDPLLQLNDPMNPLQFGGSSAGMNMGLLTANMLI